MSSMNIKYYALSACSLLLTLLDQRASTLFINQLQSQNLDSFYHCLHPDAQANSFFQNAEEYLRFKNEWLSQTGNDVQSRSGTPSSSSQLSGPVALVLGKRSREFSIKTRAKQPIIFEQPEQAGVKRKRHTKDYEEYAVCSLIHGPPIHKSLREGFESRPPREKEIVLIEGTAINRKSVFSSTCAINLRTTRGLPKNIQLEIMASEKWKNYRWYFVARHIRKNNLGNVLELVDMILYEAKSAKYQMGRVNSDISFTVPLPSQIRNMKERKKDAMDTLAQIANATTPMNAATVGNASTEGNAATPMDISQ